MKYANIELLRVEDVAEDPHMCVYKESGVKYLGTSKLESKKRINITMEITRGDCLEESTRLWEE
jgi:hypothetical protein